MKFSESAIWGQRAASPKMLVTHVTQAGKSLEMKGFIRFFACASLLLIIKKAD
jgi:hypothetical protein